MDQLPDRCPAVDDTTSRPYWQLTSKTEYACALAAKHPFLATVGGAFLGHSVGTNDAGDHVYLAYLLSGVYYSTASRPVTADEFYRMVHQHITR